MLFKERVAVVTGSGRGLGKAIAKRFVEEGVKVIINDIDQGPAEEALKEIEAIGGSGCAALQVGDISKKDEAYAIVNAAVEKFGKIDILVNNAGMWRDAMFHKMSEDLFDLVVKINLYGTFYCTQAAYLHMKEKKYGRIVNFTSQAGIAGNVGQANYCAAKSGVIGLTKSNAKEFARSAITVNVVAPTATGTRALEGLPTEHEKAFVRMLPLGRWGTVEEIAAGVAFLSSDEAGYITGQLLGIDGGFSIGKP